jgi:signal transduction histidine kinase
MQNTIEDILDISRIKFKNFHINYSWFSFNDVVNEIFDIVDYQASSKGVQLAQDISPDLNDPICTDMKRIKQVLLNLMQNALKFTSNGSITVKAFLDGEKAEEIDGDGLRMRIS